MSGFDQVIDPADFGCLLTLNGVSFKRSSDLDVGEDGDGVGVTLAADAAGVQSLTGLQVIDQQQKPPKPSSLKPPT